jgi:large subunit ribosomal protein L31e
MSSSDFEERVVTVPLRNLSREPSNKRAGKAMTLIREHLAQHFKVEPGAVRLEPAINEAIWSRGRSNPPRKFRVRAARFVEDGEPVVEAEPA